MKAEMSAESYALVEKMAYKFAYGNTSYQYEKYVSAGLEGLIKAIKTFNPNSDAVFSTYANTCIRNAMCTAQKVLKRFDLQEDENVVIEDINTMSTEMVDDNMENVAKRAILKVNNQNERNAEMFMLHIGLTCGKPMDYKDLSAKFNVSAERVRQVCVKTRAAINENKNIKSLLYSFVG